MRLAHRCIAGTVGALAVVVSSLGVSASASASVVPSASDGAAASAQRVVALGEEDVLADLLALGIEPVASTATVPTAGFHAVDQYDTSAIEPLPIDIDLERLAALDPDLIVVYEVWLSYVPAGAFDDIAPTIVVPNGITASERIRLLAEEFDEVERAEELIAAVDVARETAGEALQGLDVSVAAIYAGPSIAAFVDGPWVIPQSLLDSGVNLVPSPDAVEGAEVDGNGRMWLSIEQLSVLSAPTLLLLQTDLVEGESAAIAQVDSSPLWPTLPAVAAENVHTLDRLGYPGIEGQARAFDDLVEVLAGRDAAAGGSTGP